MFTVTRRRPSRSRRSSTFDLIQLNRPWNSPGRNDVGLSPWSSEIFSAPDEPSPVLDRTALLIRPKRVVEAANSTAGSQGRYPNTRWFVVDAMLALVYPARSCWNQRTLATTRVAPKRRVIRRGRFADSKVIPPPERVFPMIGLRNA